MTIYVTLLFYFVLTCYILILNYRMTSLSLIQDRKECLMDISCKGFLSLESEYALLVLDCNTVALSQSSLENLHYV